jgi:hypothetical protein
MEEIWGWDGINVVSKSFFGTNVSVVIIFELDVIEITIDGIETSGSTKVEHESGWWSVMLDGWVSDSFEGSFSDEGRVNFLFGGRVSRVDIEPITIDIGVFEWNFFTDVSRVSTDVISTEAIGWFLVLFPRVEEER